MKSTIEILLFLSIPLMLGFALGYNAGRSDLAVEGYGKEIAKQSLRYQAKFASKE